MSIKIAAQGCSDSRHHERMRIVCASFMHQGWIVSATSNPNLRTLLKLTDIIYEGNKKMYSAPFRNAVMSPRWPFNWKYLDGVFPATVMHQSLMACQEGLVLFVGAHFLSPHRQIMRELMNSVDRRRGEKPSPLRFCYNFSGSCSSKSGDFNFNASPYWAGNLIQKLILVRANKLVQMSIGLHVHSALRILHLSVLKVIRFALRRAHKSSGWCDFKVPRGRERHCLKTL